eukprot:2700301-Rhodomonas_salina.1
MSSTRGTDSYRPRPVPRTRTDSDGGGGWYCVVLTRSGTRLESDAELVQLYEEAQVPPYACLPRVRYSSGTHIRRVWYSHTPPYAVSGTGIRCPAPCPVLAPAALQVQQPLRSNADSQDAVRCEADFARFQGRVPGGAVQARR